MSKKSIIQRNNKRILLSKALADKRADLVSRIKNPEIPINERFLLKIKLSKLPRDSSKVRIRNRCLLTGRPRGYYRKFKMSRICLRTLALMGLMPGLVKSSW